MEARGGGPRPFGPPLNTSPKSTFKNNALSHLDKNRYSSGIYANTRKFIFYVCLTQKNNIITQVIYIKYLTVNISTDRRRNALKIKLTAGAGAVYFPRDRKYQ